MTEWLALALIAPAIIAPVVLLTGFAGCKFQGHGTPIPFIKEAVGASATRIDLTVSYPTPVLGFEVERRIVADRPEAPFTVDATTTVDTFEIIDASTSRIIDRDLLPQTTYYYSVRAIKTDGQYSDWSAVVDSSFFPGTTSSYVTAFAWTAGELAGLRDGTPRVSWTLVQRIAASRLSQSGEYVRITLRASSVDGASIDKVYISQPDSTAGADLYDSAADLTEVTSTRMVIPPNGSMTTPPARYRLDETQPLLVIVEFSPSPPSGIQAADAAQPGDGDLFIKVALGEAIMTNRSGYTTSAVPAIGLIEKIEVA